MENKEIDIDLLTADANSLSNAINALEDYSYFRLGLNKPNLNDICKLQGLISSIKILSEKHAKEMSSFQYGGINNEK